MSTNTNERVQHSGNPTAKRSSDGRCAVLRSTTPRGASFVFRCAIQEGTLPVTARTNRRYALGSVSTSSLEPVCSCVSEDKPTVPKIRLKAVCQQLFPRARRACQHPGFDGFQARHAVHQAARAICNDTSLPSFPQTAAPADPLQPSPSSTRRATVSKNGTTSRTS